ncbi:MAG: hypothetical protein J3K34DRAFT_505988 [Monoraphidium minutum]|nr:MAG: hypothetical protein J3K34DRAFT_505988 [Monoraphidium minutum]
MRRAAAAFVLVAAAAVLLAPHQAAAYRDAPQPAAAEEGRPSIAAAAEVADCDSAPAGGCRSVSEAFDSCEALLQEARTRLAALRAATPRPPAAAAGRGSRRRSAGGGGSSKARGAARRLQQDDERLQDFARPDCGALELLDPILPCAEPLCAPYFELRSVIKPLVPDPAPLPPGPTPPPPPPPGAGGPALLPAAPVAAAPPNIVCAQIAPLPPPPRPVSNGVQTLPSGVTRTVVLPVNNVLPDVPYDYDYAFSFGGDNVLLGASSAATANLGARLTTREGFFSGDATAGLDAGAVGVLGPFLGARANLGATAGADASLEVVQNPTTPLTLLARAGLSVGGQGAAGIYAPAGAAVVPREPRGSDEDRVAFPVSNLRLFGLLP